MSETQPLLGRGSGGVGTTFGTAGGSQLSPPPGDPGEADRESSEDLQGEDLQGFDPANWGKFVPDDALRDEEYTSVLDQQEDMMPPLRQRRQIYRKEGEAGLVSVGDPERLGCLAEGEACL